MAVHVDAAANSSCKISYIFWNFSTLSFFCSLRRHGLFTTEMHSSTSETDVWDLNWMKQTRDDFRLWRLMTGRSDQRDQVSQREVRCHRERGKRGGIRNGRKDVPSPSFPLTNVRCTHLHRGAVKPSGWNYCTTGAAFFRADKTQGSRAEWWIKFQLQIRFWLPTVKKQDDWEKTIMCCMTSLPVLLVFCLVL